MAPRADWMTRLQGTQLPAGKDPDEARVDYLSAARTLKRSILVIYLIGLVIVMAVDAVYWKTGNKTLAMFLVDLLLYNVAALIIGMAVYQVASRGWLKAYASERALVTIGEVSSDAVYSITAESLISAWSKGAERIFGYSESEAVGQSMAIVLPDDFMERDIAVLEPLLTDGIITGHRTLSRRKDGSVFPSEVSASLQKTPAGEPASILIVLRDITEQIALENELHGARDELEVRVEERTAELKEANALLKREMGERARAELALKESEEHFRSLIENASDIIVVVDHLGRVEYVSPSITGVLGFTPQELNGVNALALAHPEDLEEVSRQLAETTVESGVTRTAEFRFRRSNGSFVFLEGIGTSVIDDLGNIRVIINARDITARKLDEEKIHMLNDELGHSIVELREVNTELEAFSFSVSHDLRAPLRAIKGFSDMLLEEQTDGGDDDSRRLLELVSANAGRMSDLIEGLLVFSRLGRQEMHRVDVDMTALARAVLDEAVSAGVDDPPVTIEELPRAAGDPLLLRQVFANLVSNALKFSSGVSSPSVRIGGARDDGECVYYVRDNGVGFNMEYADRLFGVFQRLHSSEEFEGTGIGLANVQRIVHRHSGRVWAESGPGEGATFYFSLPAP
jgi:PAS domain S-box-containing protein